MAVYLTLRGEWRALKQTDSACELSADVLVIYVMGIFHFSPALDLA